MNEKVNRQSNVALRLGAVLFGIGLLLNIVMVATNAWPTSLYIILMGVGAVAMALGLWARRNWLRPDKPLGFLKRNIGTLSLVLVAGLGAGVFFWTNVESTETFEMEWGHGPPHPQRTDVKHIVLTFVEYPNHYIGIYSSDLAEYLERLPSRRVPVTFEVVRDFGRVRGYQEIQIAELKQWTSVGGYGGRKGNYNPAEPSPWD